MSERLLRFARNDNMQCAIKVQGRCHCEGFRVFARFSLFKLLLSLALTLPLFCLA